MHQATHDLEMNIKLKLGVKDIPFEKEVEDHVKVVDLVNEYEDKLKNKVYAAKGDNQIISLETEVRKFDKIEFLDISNHAAHLTYQNGVILLYLKAVKDVLGDCKVQIENALNKGVYTVIKKREGITAKEVDKIAERMRELRDQNIPFEKNNDSYVLGDTEAFLCGLMVPSTKFIDLFEVKKYRRGVLIRFPHPSNPNEMPSYVDEVNLYSAFSEAVLWGKLTKVTVVEDLNNKIKTGEYKELIQLSEALHEKRVAELADTIKREKKRIILIAGPSSSGKTTFAKRLIIQLKVNGLNPMYMGTDDYFVERTDTPLDENGEPNFEDLEAIDIELFNKNINDLLDGETVDMPTFNFIEGKKEYGKRITKISSDQPIVIEGIHALNENLTEFMPEDEKFKIYISPLTQLGIDGYNRISTTDARMLRRMVRDYNFRGHSAKSTIQSWPKVRKGEEKNIFPFSNEADAFFNSVHLYEISVLKKYAAPLLREIKKSEEEYGDAMRLLTFLEFFETIEDDTAIPNNSIIREFIGGSIMV